MRAEELARLRALYDSANLGPLIADLDIFDPDDCEIEACLSTDKVTFLSTAATGAATVSRDALGALTPKDDDGRAEAWRVARASSAFAATRTLAALHNAAPDLLDAAERTVLLDEVRRVTGDPYVYLCPLFADLACTIRKWSVVSDACKSLGSGPTEVDALRDALGRLAA